MSGILGYDNSPVVSVEFSKRAAENEGRRSSGSSSSGDSRKLTSDEIHLDRLKSIEREEGYRKGR
ncbi:MAG: hypothetical protein WCS86_01245 [Candidatus Paceibacterota bacterium]